MVEQIGFAPSFDPRSIKDFLVRGYVYSALHFALKQKVPSKAVKEFSRDLGTLEPSEFEKKYGVPSARLRHQLRPKNADWLVKRARWELRRLEEDLSSAENYWKKVFEHVTKKYFKSRRQAISDALKNSSWYPYAMILQEKEEVRHADGTNEMDYMYDQPILAYVVPTDRKEERRLLNFEKNLPQHNKYGWIFLRQVFATIKTKGVRMNCLIIETIQRPKIISLNSAYEIPPLPAEVLKFGKTGRAEAGSAYPPVRLLELETKRSPRAYGIDDVLYMLDQCNRAILALEEEGGPADVLEALKKWRDLPAWKEVERLSRLHSPQSLHRIDFLPAFLASVFFIERNYPKLMRDMGAVVISLRGILEPLLQVATIGRGYPKEKEEYVRLIEILGAEEMAEGLYATKFSK